MGNQAIEATRILLRFLNPVIHASL